MGQKRPVNSYYVTANYGTFTSSLTEVHVYASALEVMAYVLLLTNKPHRGRCGGEGVADLNECECANITNPVGYIIYIYYTCMAASSSLELQKITWF